MNHSWSTMPADVLRILLQEGDDGVSEDPFWYMEHGHFWLLDKALERRAAKRYLTPDDMIRQAFERGDVKTPTYWVYCERRANGKA